MSRLISSVKKGLSQREVLFSAFVLAFAGLGDAFLYLALPLYGQEMGFSLAWIGVFLSVNRFVRIPGNSLVAWLIRRIGYRSSLALASGLAVVTTCGYGLGLDSWGFLLARALWGLSYSALRVSSLAYAAEAKKNKNLMFGLLQSIKTMGAVLALFLGPLLIQAVGLKATFIWMALLSLTGLFFALALQNIPLEKTIKKTVVSSSLIKLKMLTFLVSFMVDGVLVVALSKVFPEIEIEELVLVVAGYLLFRKLCSSLISILSGWLSDRIGLMRVFRATLLMVLSSLFLIGLGQAKLGVGLAFLSNASLVALLPAMALRKSKGNKLKVLTSITTWWDIGAASGALLGLALVQQTGASLLFLLFSAVLLFPALAFVLKKKNGGSWV